MDDRDIVIYDRKKLELSNLVQLHMKQDTTSIEIRAIKKLSLPLPFGEPCG